LPDILIDVMIGMTISAITGATIVGAATATVLEVIEAITGNGRHGSRSYRSLSS
jgi:hypothetical protein